jgi:hypothetical protein
MSNLHTSAALSVIGLAFGGIALLSSAPAEASTTASHLGDRPMVSRFQASRFEEGRVFCGDRCCRCRCHWECWDRD